MATAVPRKADAFVGGLTRARLGASASDRRQDGARAVALGQAASTALADVQSPDGLAAFCELAAANPDYSVKVLLELFGQSAVGPCRTRAWIMRNGARIEKGERGLAVSMFGGYVWPLRSTTGRFGSIGVESGDAPSGVVDGWADLAAGDRIAGAMLTALRGYRPTVSDRSVTVERLERALERFRATAYAMPACVSCDGAGCLLCSCEDDRNRVAVLDYSAMTREREPKRIGRPKALRPDLPKLRGELERVAVLRAEADRLAAEARDVEFQAMRAAVESGRSLADVAAVAGVSKARVAQIVNR